MVKKENERIYLTFSKAQVKWLRSTAKKLGFSVSRLVKWLIDKNISHICNALPSQTLDELIRIAKTPWLDFDDGDDY